MTTIRAADLPRPSLAWLALLALPLFGLAVLIARPELDLEWRHQPSHFWLVLIVAVVSLALAYLTNEAAMRRGDARLFLISLAFGASAGFLGLHALATPGVLLPSPNLGFVIATPVGLTIAAGLAAAAALPLGGPRGDLALRHAGLLRGAVVAVLVAWGARVDPRGPGVHVGGRAGGGRASAPARRPPGGRPVRLRCVAFPAPPRPAGPTAPARRRRRPRPPRRGDGDRRLQSRLASLVVGVASPDGDRLRRGRVRGADRVPARGLADGCVRRPLPVRHPRAAASMACRSPLRPRFGAGRGSIDGPHPRPPPHRRRDDRRARPPRARRGRAATRRRALPAVRPPDSSSTGRGPIPGRRASGAARSAR